jgi:hypothetical protein
MSLSLLPNELLLNIATMSPVVYFKLMITSKHFYNLLKQEYSLNLLYKIHKTTISNTNGYYSWKYTYLGDFLHSFNDEPAVIIKEDNFKACELYYTLGFLNRINKPAVNVYIIPSNTIIFWEYWSNGKLHRENEPCRFELYQGVEYWNTGKLHNQNGPAIHKYIDKIAEFIDDQDTLNFKTFTVDIMEYWVNGKLHNNNGPAVINNDLNIEEYWINGVKTNWNIINSRYSFRYINNYGSTNNTQLTNVFILPDEVQKHNINFI